VGKSSATKVRVADYFLSLHYGVCAVADSLIGIKVGDKIAWEGVATEEQAISVANTQLFGGMFKEGGVAGYAYWLPGGQSQVMPEHLAAKFGLTSETCPGFHGFSSVFFHGSGIYSPTSGVALNGFMWGSNNPYLRPVALRVSRQPDPFEDEGSLIGLDANPAAIILDCLLNTDWGMGAAGASVDYTSFYDAMVTLAEEGFGLSMIWTRQSTIEQFINEIIDHIQATMFVNPRNGKITLKLIRGDYVIGDLPVLDTTNCRVTSFDRKAWGETANEIVVTWTNPDNEKEETVVAQDLANISIQGIVSDSRNYYGVRNADLAMRLARRDLAMASSPFASYEIEVDRSAWDFIPGGCAVLNYPEYGISGLVLRIMKIDYGKPGQPTIKVNAMEDIFARPTSAYTTPDGSAWVDPSADPEPMDSVWVITTPAYFASRVLSASEAASFEYPEVLAAILASQDNGDTMGYDLVSQTVLPTGDVVGEVIASKPLLGQTLLEDTLLAETTSTIPAFTDIDGGAGPVVGGFMFIGGVAEQYQEIALVTGFSSGSWTVKRGMLDTIPRQWEIGTRVWFVNSSSSFIDTGTIRASGDTVRYKLLSRTSRGRLSQAEAPVRGAVLTERPYLPNRPANVKVEGTMYGILDVSGSSPTSLDVTWSNRNRLLEDGTLVGWEDGDVTPEAGQTTKISIYKPDGTPLGAETGLTGTSHTLDITGYSSEPVIDIILKSVRDGLESQTGFGVRVKLGGGGGVPDPIEPPPEGGGEDPDPGETFPDIPEWYSYETP